MSLGRISPANPSTLIPNSPNVPGSGTVWKVIVPPDRLAVSVLPPFVNTLLFVSKESEPLGSQAIRPAFRSPWQNGICRALGQTCTTSSAHPWLKTSAETFSALLFCRKQDLGLFSDCLPDQDKYTHPLVRCTSRFSSRKFAFFTMRKQVCASGEQ
jgi:hypothetical protein